MSRQAGRLQQGWGRALGLVSRRLCAAPACSEDAAQVAAASPLPLRPGPRIKAPDSRHGPRGPPPKRHEPQERAAGVGAQGSRLSRPRTPRRLLARRGNAALVSGRPGASRGGSAARPPWQPRQPGGKPGGGGRRRLRPGSRASRSRVRSFSSSEQLGFHSCFCHHG